MRLSSALAAKGERAMDGFAINPVYEDGLARRVLEINPLPGKYCCFDCVYCPLGKNDAKTAESFFFEGTRPFIKTLEDKLANEEIDVLYINPAGEAFANKEFIDVARLGKKYGKIVSLFTNGYVLGWEENRELLSLFDEVTGELSVVREADFQKLHRPLPGFTLHENIDSMVRFRQWYKGKFTFCMNVIKGYSDSDEAIAVFRQFISDTNPDEILVATITDEKYQRAFSVSDEVLQETLAKLKSQ